MQSVIIPGVVCGMHRVFHRLTGSRRGFARCRIAVMTMRRVDSRRPRGLRLPGDAAMQHHRAGVALQRQHEDENCEEEPAKNQCYT